MHLRFSSNSNNLNAQVNSNELHKLKKKDYASVLPVVLSIESVDFVKRPLIREYLNVIQTSVPEG